MRIFQYQINRYERTKECMDAIHKNDTRVVFTFLGNQKELILFCVNRERQELLQKEKKNKTTSNENENTKTICALGSKVKT